MKQHKRIAAIAFLSLLATSLAYTQEQNHAGQAYLFFAPGAVMQNGRHLGMLHVEGGGGRDLLQATRGRRGIGVRRTMERIFRRNLPALLKWNVSFPA